jgi:hypothetical protein
MAEGVLKCCFTARPVTAIDTSQDVSMSVAMRFTDKTTAEDVVREALRHATGKLEATLECAPQRMVVLLRDERRVSRLDISRRLLDSPEFSAAASTGRGAVIMLSAPDKIELNVQRLTQPQGQEQIAQRGAAATQQMGFMSFIRRPTMEELAANVSAQTSVRPSPDAGPAAHPPDPPTLERSRSANSLRGGVAGPSEMFVRHAATALQRAGSSSRGFSPEGASGAAEPNLPLTAIVIYYSKFGGRFEAEVPYMSADPADKIIGDAAAQITSQLNAPHLSAEDVRGMALYYRRKDGSDRIFAGQEPLPLPRTTRPPALYLAPLPSGYHSQTQQAQGQPPTAAALLPDRNVGSGSRAENVDKLVPASLRQDDQHHRDACHDMAKDLAQQYAAVKQDKERLRRLEANTAAAELERAELLRSRRAAQERWTDCAAASRDIERLLEQISWFEKEVAEQREREAALRQKLHKLTAEARFVEGTRAS